MRITHIVLDGPEDGDTAPTQVTVRMTLAEAVYVTKVLGAMNGIQAEQVMPGGAHASNEIYSCLTGELFNRFWEDGVDDALRGLA